MLKKWQRRPDQTLRASSSKGRTIFITVTRGKLSKLSTNGWAKLPTDCEVSNVAPAAHPRGGAEDGYQDLLCGVDRAYAAQGVKF